MAICIKNQQGLQANSNPPTEIMIQQEALVFLDFFIFVLAPARQHKPFFSLKLLNDLIDCDVIPYPPPPPIHFPRAAGSAGGKAACTVCNDPLCDITWSIKPYSRVDGHYYQSN